MFRTVTMFILHSALFSCGPNGNIHGPDVPQPTPTDRAIEVLTETASALLTLPQTRLIGGQWVVTLTGLRQLDGMLETTMGTPAPRQTSPSRLLADILVIDEQLRDVLAGRGLPLVPGSVAEDFLVSWSNAWLDSIRIVATPGQKLTRSFVESVYRGTATNLRARAATEPTKAAAFRAMADVLDHLADVVGSRLP